MNDNKEINKKAVDRYLLGKYAVQSIVGVAVIGVVTKTLEAVLIASTCENHINTMSKVGIFAIAALVGLKCSDMSEETYHKIMMALLRFKAVLNEIDGRESITNQEAFELFKKYLKEELGFEA